MLFEEVAELTGQRNAIDGRLVAIVAEIHRDGLWGATGCRSVPALVAWKTGVSPHRAQTIVSVAQRLEEFPLCAAGMQDGRLSLDQVGAIADGAAPGSDAHYAQLADSATVTQLRKAIHLEPRPDPPDPEPEPQRSFTRTDNHDGTTTWKIRLSAADAATVDAAVQSHHDALIAQYKRDHPTAGDTTPPLPGQIEAFLSLVDAGWDTDVAARPHGQRTTVVIHVDVEQRVAALHLGPVLSDADRRYLTCDATCEVWFQRHGQPIGAGRETRQINRRLRRALEHRDRCCVVPGCGATRGLQAHHLTHWEDGGLTELANLTLICPFHHRLHHRGLLTLTGPADHLVVTDAAGRTLTPGSLARPPTRPPPAVPPCPGPTGERADWWWYTPFEPQAPDSN